MLVLLFICSSFRQRSAVGRLELVLVHLCSSSGRWFSFRRRYLGPIGGRRRPQASMDVYQLHLHSPFNGNSCRNSSMVLLLLELFYVPDE
mgnify:CR=1 FL=1